PELQEDLFKVLAQNNRASGVIVAKVLRRIVKRLNKFIHYLLSHPIFSTHELVWEFLVVSEIQRDLITHRTHSKVSYLLENIYDTYPTFVEDLQGENVQFANAGATLGILQGGVRHLGITARKLGSCRK
ncbi:hypothetical protein HK102_010741, partial [Quaeritorhiza haematococci]